MISLRPLFAALTLFDTGQLFQFPMQWFYNPMPLVLILNHRHIDRTWGTICDHRVHVTFCGNYLEKRHSERNFLELDGDSIPELFLCPFY